MVDGLKDKAGPFVIAAAAAAIAGYIIYRGKNNSGTKAGNNSANKNKEVQKEEEKREPTQVSEEDDLPQFNWLDESLTQDEKEDKIAEWVKS